MDLNERVDNFHRFECNLTEDEKKYWDVYRHDLFLAVVYNDTEISRKITKKNKHNFFLLAKNFIRTQIAFSKNKHKNVFYATSRYLLNNNVYYDPNIYDIYKELENDSFVIESYSDKVSTTYPSCYNYSINIYRKIYLFFFKKQQFISENLIIKINNYFNSNITKSFYDFRINNYIFEKKYYQRLLKKIKPKKFFLVQNGIQKGLISACHKLNIPIIELQHGDIGFTHPVYYFPNNYDCKYNISPDYLFVYSNFWKHRILFPNVKIEVLGNSFNYIKPSVNNKIYGVSIFTNTLHTPLFDKFIADLLDTGYSERICYKLHPQQINEFEGIKRKWEKYKNIDVVFLEKNSIEVIQSSENVITIHSTVVFQSIDSGRRTFLLTANDEYLSHKDIFDYPNVYLVNSVQNFLEKKELPLQNNDNKRIFDKFSKSKFLNIMKEIDERYNTK